MVVSSGTVVVLEEGNAEGQPAGTYIKLVLANSDAPLYINAASLVDIYTPRAGATQVQIAISPENIISATIVADAIGAVELATNAVTTEKIVDANVTKVKLSSEVQTSLGKADSAIQKVTIVGHELTDGGVVTVEQVKTALALGSAAYEDASAFEVAGAANAESDGFVYYAHFNGTNYVDKFYEGAYKGWSDGTKLRSMTSMMPTVNTSLNDFRSLARAHGSGYNLRGYYQLLFW